MMRTSYMYATTFHYTNCSWLSDTVEESSRVTNIEYTFARSKLTKMMCVENCACITCLQLKGCEAKIQKKKVNDGNFILTKSNEFKNISADSKIFTFFGMEHNLQQYTSLKNVKTKNTDFGDLDSCEQCEYNKNKHKSIIYVNDIINEENKKFDGNANIIISEKIDEALIICSVENSLVINVKFQETYSFASQIINEMQMCGNKYYDIGELDNFPMGMEADLFCQYIDNTRLSRNTNQNLTSDSVKINHHSSIPLYKDLTSPNVGTLLKEPDTTRNVMVSPKCQSEQFQHLYVANNVKTSTTCEEMKKNVFPNAIKTLNTSFNDNGLHTLNMIPERDTTFKVSSRETNALNKNEEQRIFTTTDYNHLNDQHINLQKATQYNSSSDENRSSGHASMSDTGNSLPRVESNSETTRINSGVIQKSLRIKSMAHQSRSKHRATSAKLQIPWTANGGLEDIKVALHELTMRSQTSASTYSTISAGSESSEPVARRLLRHSSIETINTNVSGADDFVWVDSHNRLVELQHLPWTNHCILRVLQLGRCKEHMGRVNVDTIPRLSYLLQRGLVRLSRESQRLSSTLDVCTKHDITIAFRIVLCPPLADACTKACLRAAAMFAMSTDTTFKQSKSARAGLHLHVGRFYRWMCDVNLARFIHEYAAIYLCAGIENLLEEIILQCLSSDAEINLTPTILERAIANNGDLWGLLQPYAHLNAGRIASGALCLPRWASVSNMESNASSELSICSTEPSFMTTCVGSLLKLQDLINKMQPKIALCSKAMQTLYYFMRCSQLEHDHQTGNVVQELSYERAYVVLPPLVEWLRVATAHGEHRFAAVIDKDDIMQAARLLLPGVDCPVRSLGEEAVRIRKNTGSEENFIEASRQIQIQLAFRLMLTGRPELIQQAIPLLPIQTKLDTFDSQGHTALMLAALSNDHVTVNALLDAGASVDIETPCPLTPTFASVNGECQHWTALTYASARGHLECAKLLLDHGANVEGGAHLADEKCTLTPLQLVSGSGNLEMVSLLCSYGANPFMSTQKKDTLCYSSSSQRGSYSPICVAAAHGHRNILKKMLSYPLALSNKEILSLEEMLAESAPGKKTNPSNAALKFSKCQIKTLQEAMYHSAENNYLDITIEIRSLGVSWTLHCWMHSLSAAHEARLDCVIDQLLQDFLQVCPDEYSSQFVQECLPLLFNIFRYSKKEGTTLLLADIFSTCYGWEPIKSIKNYLPAANSASRIDPKYVNNPELSDVKFCVEGKIFYAHKIVLFTASSRLRAMLNSKLCEGGVPTVQINDIRYHIFQVVMQFLYQGGCQTIEPPPEDILELMAAANFFQLDGLLHYCESRCGSMLALDNVVSMYIHAKVYNAIQLLEYCQGFLIQNMVALLTYDDSVKRLLFAKKIPNHDVLASLLNNLQNRIKTKINENKGIFN